MIRVLLLDPVRLICHVFQAALEAEADVEVVACALSVGEALDQLERADVILVNALSNGVDLEFIGRILAASPSAQILSVGLPADKDAILRRLEAGAGGYVLNEDSLNGLLEGVRAVVHGEARLSPDVAAALIARLAELRVRCDGGGEGTDSAGGLSPREREVLELLRLGLSNREIAERLTIELGTVKNHVHSLLKKLNVSSRHAAAKLFP